MSAFEDRPMTKLSPSSAWSNGEPSVVTTCNVIGGREAFGLVTIGVIIHVNAENRSFLTAC